MNVYTLTCSFIMLVFSHAENALFSDVPFGIDFFLLFDAANTSALKVKTLGPRPPSGTRFLWYYSAKTEPLVWMLLGVGENIILEEDMGRGNSLVNLTVLYPNGESVSTTRLLRHQVNLSVDVFVNRTSINTNQKRTIVPLRIGDKFSFECRFYGYPSNVRILLPDGIECEQQEHTTPQEDTISLQCLKLAFQEGSYGCQSTNARDTLKWATYLSPEMSRAKSKYCTFASGFIGHMLVLLSMSWLFS